MGSHEEAMAHDESVNVVVVVNDEQKELERVVLGTGGVPYCPSTCMIDGLS